MSAQQITPRDSLSPTNLTSGQSPTPPTPPPKEYVDQTQAALLQSARLKLSSRDQEAMRRVRSTLIDVSDSASAGSSSSPSPMTTHFPPSVVPNRTRASTLSKEVAPQGLLNNRKNIGLAESHSSHNLLAPAPRCATDLDKTPKADDDNNRTPNGLASNDHHHVIAVVGHEGVGKTAVIRRALKTWGISKPVTVSHDGHSVSSSLAAIGPEGKLQSSCRVEFIELNVRTLNLTGVGPVWPNFIPKVSGVLLCYDATRRDSLRGLSEALHLLSQSLPMVIFACKSDPGASLEVEAAVGDSIGQPYYVGLVEVSTFSPWGKNKMRSGIRWLLYKLEQSKRKAGRESLPAPSTDMRKAVIDPSTSASSSDQGHADSDTSTDQVLWKPGHLPITSSLDQESDTRSSSSSLGWMMRQPTSQSLKDEAGEQAGSRGLVADNGNNQTPDSAGIKTDDGVMPSEQPPLYSSLEDLFNQLFSSIVSTEDELFISAFFMTYRRFCQPLELIKEFLKRYHEVEQYVIPKDVKHWALIKITGALIKWTTDYPGDLANEPAMSVFRETLALTLKHTFMGHLTAELVMNEQTVVDSVDLDSSWAISSDDKESIGRSSSVITGGSAVELVLDDDVLYEIESGSGTAGTKEKSLSSQHSMSTNSLSVEPEPMSAGSITAPTGYRNNNIEKKSGGLDAASDASKSIHSLEDAGGYFRWVHGVALIVNSDPRWFAHELSRMQWELFSDVRPRDVLRHVLGKEKDDPVGRSIAFFNHLSRWVSTMILASPKPKQRARVYVAFVKIAHQLRRLNNYDSLYAVISGMRETSVHRLSQTHQLVKIEPGLSRDFQSHLKLMDTRGGYVHYRRALQADIQHGRGAIPLLTAVLSLVTRLQVVRREDRRDDGMIQWDKFAKFGEILSIVSECQARGSIAFDSASPNFRRIIEDTPVITDEDGLFERSRMLEPPMGTAAASGGVGVLRKLANLGL